MKAKKQETAATMKDVALKAKVSTATVSRALMNPDKVSQATRNRVEKAAREVGYLPQPMGRNVKRNESRTILVIVPDICDPFFSEIIRGIEVTAANHGYLVLIGDCAHQNHMVIMRYHDAPCSSAFNATIRSTSCGSPEILLTEI